MSLLEDIAATITKALDRRSGETKSRGLSASILGSEATYAQMPDAVAAYLRLESGTAEAIADAEAMDNYPMLSSAYDIYADDVTQTDFQTGRAVWVTAKSKKYERVLEELMQTLEMEDRIWADTRFLVKYGSLYWEPVLSEEDGVVRLNVLPPGTMRVVQDRQAREIGFVQDFSAKPYFSEEEYDRVVDDYARWHARRREREARGEKLQPESPPAIPFEAWQVVHLKLAGRNPYSPYGTPLFDQARWVWRRLLLLDDAVLRFRLDRAPERYAYYVNVGQKTDQEAFAYVNRFKQSVRKRRYMDASGKLALKMDPVAADEDVFIPFRNGDETRVETLASPVWQNVDDAEFFRTMLYASIKIPRAYLGDETGVVRATLSSQDVRFARTVLRVQRQMKRGIAAVCRVHLAAMGVDPSSVDFEVHMTAPSAIFELAQLEVRNARADLASRMREHVSMREVLETILGFSKTEIETILQERVEDIKREGAAAAGGGPEEGGGDEGGFPTEIANGAPDDPSADGQPNTPEDAQPQQQPESRARPRLVASRPKPMVERRHPPADRRVEQKLEEVLRNDAALVKRLTELKGLLHDLRAATARRAA